MRPVSGGGFTVVLVRPQSDEVKEQEPSPKGKSVARKKSSYKRCFQS